MLDSQEFNFRFQCGVGEPAASMTLEDKQRIVDTFCLHYSIFATLTELDQVKQGLTAEKFNVLMEKYPNAVRAAFQPVKEYVGLFCMMFCMFSVCRKVHKVK